MSDRLNQLQQRSSLVPSNTTANMDDEDFDELSMGPSGKDVKSVLQSGDTASNPNPHVLRSSLRSSTGSAPPPSSMFNTTRPVSPPAGGSRPFSDQPPAIATSPSQSPESRRIRQEALRMLEVADDQLEEGPYSVYRTKTGGFTAEARKEGDSSKRLPAALSGVNFATSRKNVARPFRDDPYADTEAPAPTSQESYEYGDDTAVVDLPQLESRASSSRAEENKSSSWSARYSIDNTMLALSGGSVSSSKLLDKMDKDSRRSAGNLFNSSPSETRAPKIFGSGFSFRKDNVFGKQNVATTPKANDEQDIRSIYKDSTTEPAAPASPARSWQEQFQSRRRQRRNLFVAGGAVVIVCLILVISLTHKERNSEPNGASAVDSADFDDKSLTFYVTSDVPLHSVRDVAFHNDLSRMSKTAEFLVHLGDMQLAQNTQCKPQRYSEVAALLRRSPLPVFVVPGEEDWANCPDQEEGWKNWKNNFWQFDAQYPTEYDIYRMQDQGENFAFLLKGVLFIGVHETNGRIDFPTELKRRNDRNVEWIKKMFNRHGKKARALVLLANGRPAIRENDPFYIGVGDFLFRNKIPTAYIHANDENGKELTYQPFEIEGMEHVIAIQSSKGEDHAPLRINVGFDKKDPFIVG